MSAKKAEQMANVSEIQPCVCSNRTQDKKYGVGNRLHFRCNGGFRCGSCKSVKLTPKKKSQKAEEATA